MTTASFRITLRSCPNPDRDETRAPKAPRIDMGTLDEVLATGRAYSVGIGGGNWHVANIYRNDGGRWRLFARMSYNGRVWTPGEDSKPMFEAAQ